VLTIQLHAGPVFIVTLACAPEAASCVAVEVAESEYPHVAGGGALWTTVSLSVDDCPGHVIAIVPVRVEPADGFPGIDTRTLAGPCVWMPETGEMIVIQSASLFKLQLQPDAV
jgi:hypothetical protein